MVRAAKGPVIRRCGDKIHDDSQSGLVADGRTVKNVSIEGAETRLSRKLLADHEPFIFVGGVPRSGTTLMRAMLDSHEEIRCGGETMIIPHVLAISQEWRGKFFKNSSITRDVIRKSVSAFITQMITLNGPMASRLCNKDPFTALHTKTLHRMYPNAKFILMIRDARATVHSMIESNVPVRGFNHSDLEGMLTEWNNLFTIMYKQCVKIPSHCLMVFYERLVQVPEQEMRRILEFLDVEWSEKVLQHEDFIGKEVPLNNGEFSATQVKQAIHEKSLDAWIGKLKNDTLQYVDELCPILQNLGYDVSTLTPDYREFARENFHETHSILYVDYQ